ncbi:MAG: hypothetical protein H6981_10805 [Gammaproteobacteria bacterium]|nr:hypothetical protein [Gammaproteobacteria bacterium]MCP5137278.1 hypothetical protein [Gammaproteobacteria bacterium]
MLFDNKVAKMTPGEALLDAPMPELIQRMGIAIAEAQLKLDQTSVRIAAMLGDSKVTVTNAEGKDVEKSLLDLGFTPTFYHFSETEIKIKLSLNMKIEEDFGVGASLNVGNDAGATELAAAAAAAALGNEGGGGEARAADVDLENDDVNDAPPADDGEAPAADAGGGGDAAAADGDRTAISNVTNSNGKRAVLFGAAVNVEYHRKFEFDMRGASMIKTKMISIPAPSAFLEAIRESARNGGSVAAEADE